LKLIILILLRSCSFNTSPSKDITSSSRSASLERLYNTKISVRTPDLSSNSVFFILTDCAAATAVSRIDNLEFLADVIPKTTTYRQFKEKRAREVAQDAPEIEKGLPGIHAAPAGQNGVARLPGGQTTLFAASNGSRNNTATESPMPTVSMMIDPTTDTESGANGDVEMTG
jgi:hypothetical protein